MSIIEWFNRRLKADQARHAVIAMAWGVFLALVGARLVAQGPPWAWALAAGVILSLYEVLQHRTGRGDASWSDVAANMGGAGLAALGAWA